MPSIPWKNIDYCWKALASTIPKRDFWQPVPGAICEWQPKLTQLLRSYRQADLIGQSGDVNIRIGVDGTNMWKASLETVTYSFASPNLCFKADAVHLLGIYVGKEIASHLKFVNTLAVFIRELL